MTYNELKNKIAKLHIYQSSAKNCEEVRQAGLVPNNIVALKGKDGKKYEVFVAASRNFIGLTSNHRESTLERWCN